MARDKEYNGAFKSARKFFAKTAAVYRLLSDFYREGKIRIPYIEIAITTLCSLKCKHCANYINTLSPTEHFSISFEDYKKHLDNFLCGVEQIRVLKILGGEPLLNKDLEKILEYSQSKEKISSVLLTTNGTIAMDDLIPLFKRYPKLSVFVSNYTANKDLLPRLKTDEIVGKLSENNISVISPEGLWDETSPIEFFNRSKKENRNFYLQCRHSCIHILKGKLYPCPKAAMLDFKNVYEEYNPQKIKIIEGREYIDLNVPATKEKLIAFFSNADYEACNYCNFVEDRKTKVLAAIQE
jgi:organic radical activating enzyme